MSLILYAINIILALVSAFGIFCWGKVIKEVGAPIFTLKFFLSLFLNKYYIMAITSALFSSVLRFSVLKKMGVLSGFFFLSLGFVFTILTAVFILGEKASFRSWIGIGLIVIGIIVVGSK